MSQNQFAKWGVQIFFLCVIGVLGTWFYIVKPHYAEKVYESPDGLVRFEYIERLVKATPTEEVPLIIVLEDEKYSMRKLVATLERVSSPCRIIALKSLIDDEDLDDVWYSEADVLRALPHVVKVLAPRIKALVETYPTKGKPIIYGFGQGGNVGALFGLEYPELASHVLVAGGFVPSTLMPKKNIFWVDFPTYTFYHGQRDRKYGIYFARVTVEALEERQITVDINEYNEVHKLTFEMREAISQKIDQLCTSLD